MDLIKNGWFTEVNLFWPGQAFSLKVKEILYQKKSKYQDILVFESEDYGNTLVLDGIIQVTQRDEFSYQEMMANLPLQCHPNPKNVLIIGGGDGGVVREVDKHPLVENIVLCEIDEDVIEVSKRFLPFCAKGFDSKKLNVKTNDGFKFLESNQGKFDVIITDSSDPIGPGESLFKKEFYDLLKNALTNDGVLCSQGECIWLHMNIIKEMRSFCNGLFPVVDYAYCSIPTYPCGQIGFLLCSKNPMTNFKEPLKNVDSDMYKYYSGEIHRASFILPAKMRRELESSD